MLGDAPCCRGISSAFWECQAGATGRGALNLFSVNMQTSLKMCGSGSGGQVDVIIFLLEREKKNPETQKKTGNKLFHSHHTELRLEPFLKAQ